MPLMMYEERLGSSREVDRTTKQFQVGDVRMFDLMSSILLLEQLVSCLDVLLSFLKI